MELVRSIIYIIVGYLSGSILFARVCGHLFKGRDITEESDDKNPGTYNVFTYGGFWCGVFTLAGDLIKGFVPVYLYMNFSNGAVSTVWAALVLAAPVVGHIWPAYFGFKGGKGIAVTFGCLIGLVPFFRPLLVLASAFIFFSVVLKISPNYHRTVFTYIFSMMAMPLLVKSQAAVLGFAIITVSVLIKLVKSPEKKERMSVKLLWMH